MQLGVDAAGPSELPGELCYSSFSEALTHPHPYSFISLYDTPQQTMIQAMLMI